MPNIKKGLGTWLGLASSVALAAKPVVEQLSALIENTSAHWSSAEKTSLLSGAAIAGVTILGRFAQAVAHIVKGNTEV